jgi:hypothetical protein
MGSTCNQKVYAICFGFHSHFKKYINKMFCLTFSYLKTRVSGMSQYKRQDPK